MEKVENMNLRERIAAAKAKLEESTPSEVKVVLGGEITALTFYKIAGHEWQRMVKYHPPRPGTDDKELGYNSDTVPGDYPAEKIRVDGETVDQETWREIYGLLGSMYRESISAVLWSLNWLADFNEMVELGKAQTGGEKIAP